MADRCEPFLARMGASLDGELDPKAARELEDHLRGCPRCRRVYQQMKTAEQALRDGFAADGIDERREEQAAARLLTRLRAEPEPAWATRKQGRESGREEMGLPAVWRRIRAIRAGPAMRWAGGIAAATAAVLLAIRLGMPSHPLERDAIREERQERAQAERQVAGETPKIRAQSEGTAAAGPPVTQPVPGSPGNGRAELSTTMKKPESSPADRSVQTAPATEDARRSSIEEESRISSDKDEAASTFENEARTSLEATPPTRSDREKANAPAGEGPAEAIQPTSPPGREGSAGLHIRGGRAGEVDQKVEEPAGAEAKNKGGEQGQPSAARKDEAPQQGQSSATPRSDRPPPSPTEPTTWGSIKKGYPFGARDLTLHAEVADSVGEGIFALRDTLRPPADLTIRLERGSRALEGMADSHLAPAERAARWRTIGDLWEWIARQEDNPVYFGRALEAYGKGVAADASAGAPDSTRLARARAGAGLPSAAPEQPGNTTPPRR